MYLKNVFKSTIQEPFNGKALKFFELNTKPVDVESTNVK